MPKREAIPDPLPRTLPQDAGGDDALYAQYVRDKVQAGLDSMDGGGGIAHDAARRRMAKWRDD